MSSPNVINRSSQMDAPDGAFGPVVCLIPGSGDFSLTYGQFPHLPNPRYDWYSLWRNTLGQPQLTNITAEARTPPQRFGASFSYYDTKRNREIVLGGDGVDLVDIHFPRSEEPLGYDNLSGAAHAPPGGGAVGFYQPTDDSHHVFYTTNGGHIYELYWWAIESARDGGDLTHHARNDPVRCDGSPSAFFDTNNTNIVVYVGSDHHVHTLSWKERTELPWDDNLTWVAGTPGTGNLSVAPEGYYLPHINTYQIVHLAHNSHLYELFWVGVERVIGWDLTAAAAAPLSTPFFLPRSFCNSSSNTKHAVYSDEQGQLHDLSWTPGETSVRHEDLTPILRNANIPSLHRVVKAFTVESPNTQQTTQHIIFNVTRPGNDMGHDNFELVY